MNRSLLPDGIIIDEEGYFRHDGEISAELLSLALGRVGRNNGPALLLDFWSAGSLNLSHHPAVVADVWSSCEFPPNQLDPDDWVSLFDEAGYTHDEQPAPRPTTPMVLYRGCHHDRRLGMSWTTDVETARWFAQRDLGHGAGDIYTVTAEPIWLLAYIGASSRHESEFVLDPQYLTDGNVNRYQVPVAPTPPTVHDTNTDSR